jgi:hypothetical protein
MAAKAIVFRIFIGNLLHSESREPGMARRNSTYPVLSDSAEVVKQPKFTNSAFPAQLHLSPFLLESRQPPRSRQSSEFQQSLKPGIPQNRQIPQIDIPFRFNRVFVEKVP